MAKQSGALAVLHGFQAMRGIFALLVVCHHVSVHAARYWDYNWLGGLFYHSIFRVDFFFVLSGFVLWGSHRSDAGQCGMAQRFLWRRAWRIYPLLITLTLFKLLLLALVPGRSLGSYQIIPSLLALPQKSFPIIVAAWTMSFEVFFGALMAACLMLPRKVVLPALLTTGGLLVGTGVRQGISPAISGPGFFVHPFILEFLAGVVAAEWVRQRGSRTWGIALCAAALGGLIAGNFQHAWLSDHSVLWQKGFWAAVFSLGLAGLALFERSVVPENWRLKDIGNLGRASYSIFLAHGFVLMAVFAFVDPDMLRNQPLLMDLFLFLAAALAVLFGMAVWKWWEQPLSRWCKPMAQTLQVRCESPQQAS
ncbi:MAG: acyltransferase [Prosthecobacter sp.]|uniref:acyltransferase family protein n=1 Tax=Prosthecobacter sp. TaxID=1965333 RepID=UPI0019FC97E6|nr:acyltransferase [Prosthecobacter sp.]MBE2286398.1 acyltransferase [Prosthecobacter sp.]